MIRVYNIFPLFVIATLSFAQSPAPASTPAPKSAFAERAPRYRLVSNDVLNVQYLYSPEFNQTAAVQPDGFITLQLIGDVKVSGMTLEEAHDAILKAVSARLQDPEITVTLESYEKPYFTVAGEVTTPGRKDLTGRVTAVEAIAMAGGFKQDRARHDQVVLYRRVSPDLAETKILDLKSIMDKGRFDEDVTLQPGDLLVVRQSTVSKIERYVKWATVGAYFPIP